MRQPVSHDTTTRRTFLRTTAAALAAGGLAATSPSSQGEDSTPTEAELKALIKPLLKTPAQIDAWLNETAYPFGRYDAELGYIHRDRDLKEGVDGAICHYRYDQLDARRMLAHADKPCRINTYGDSFTACEQVSDGETWQEALASHLGEPVRNYGVGGYSVYQAYLRMKREERRAPAKYIVFNIFDDDHYRNLHGWRGFKFGTGNVAANGPVPHVEVDPDRKTFIERPNPCPNRESLRKLCDLDAAYQLFKNDYSLHRRAERAAAAKVGRKVPVYDYFDKEFTRRGIWATQRIVERVEKFARENDRKVLYVLSYSPTITTQFLTEGVRFDQELADFMASSKLPYVDTLEAHAADFKHFRCTIGEYIKRYYVGHYNPVGNQFQAFAIKNKLVSMLDPKPPAYAHNS